MREILFDIFIGTCIKSERVWNKDFKTYVNQEKYRIIHPLVIVLMIWFFIYCIYNGGLKEFFRECKNLCIY